MRTYALLGLLLVGSVACGGGSDDAASGNADGAGSTSGEQERDSAAAAPSNDCPYGKIQTVFSNGQPARETCLTRSGIQRGPLDEAPNAANIIQVSSPQDRPTGEMFTLQVDRATESTVRTVFLNMAPKTEASYFYAACTASPCAGITIGPSKVYEGGLHVALEGVKLVSDTGGGEATVTGTIDAR